MTTVVQPSATNPAAWVVRQYEGGRVVRTADGLTAEAAQRIAAAWDKRGQAA